MDICSCLSLTSFVRYVDEGKRGPALKTVLFLMLGIVSHISTAAIVPFALYISHKKRALRRDVLSLLGVMATVAFLFVLAIKTFYNIAPQNVTAACGFDFGMMAENYLFFWGRLLFSSFWTLARPDLTDWGEMVFGAGALCMGLWAGFRGQWKGEAAIIWIALSLLPSAFAPTRIRSIDTFRTFALFVFIQCGDGLCCGSHPLVWARACA